MEVWCFDDIYYNHGKFCELENIQKLKTLSCMANFLLWTHILPQY